MKKTVVTLNDYRRLIGLIEFASLKSKIPHLVEAILRELKDARILPSENISKDVITMNSTAELTNIETGRTIQLTITYPDDADNLERKVSVFSPIGIELLGSRVGDVVSWKVPGGMGNFRVDKIIFQPEAEGLFSL